MLHEAADRVLPDRQLRDRPRLAATHEATLEVVPLDLLKKYAIDLS